ncbi:MAG: hypothetical protein V1778_04650 [bacterium]
MDLSHTQTRSQEQKRLLARLEQEGLNFERWLITLATGTLVLSVTILGSTSATPHEHLLLIFSWIALVLSIFSGLFDRLLYIFSISAHPLLDEDESAEEPEERWLHYLTWSERTSWLQMLSFFLGIVLLLLFAIITL